MPVLVKIQAFRGGTREIKVTDFVINPVFASLSVLSVVPTAAVSEVKLFQPCVPFAENFASRVTSAVPSLYFKRPKMNCPLLGGVNRTSWFSNSPFLYLSSTTPVRQVRKEPVHRLQVGRPREHSEQLLRGPQSVC